MGPICCAFWIGTVLYWGLMSCGLLCWVQDSVICDVWKGRVTCHLYVNDKAVHLDLSNHKLVHLDLSNHKTVHLDISNHNAVHLDLSNQLKFKMIFFKTRNSVEASCQFTILSSRPLAITNHARTHARTNTEGSTQWNVTADEKWGYIEIKLLRMWGCTVDIQ